MIDSYFKQYFWTFHLLVIGLAGYLTARGANVFIRESLRLPPSALAASVVIDEAVPGQVAAVSGIPTDRFLERNVFDAEREDLTPEPSADDLAAQQAAQPQAVTAEDPCPDKSAMRVVLVGTLPVSTDAGKSVATFTDPGSNDSITVGIGDRILDQATIVSIEYRRVKVDNAGRCEYFSIEDQPTAVATASPPVAAAPPPTTQSGAPNVELGESVKKISETEYEIPKAEIDDVLGNLNVIATQARIVPSFQNGKANGFKLFSIRPGSLYSKIGIQNGDVVQKINGYEINSPDKALEIYSKLKDAQSITVDLIRRGRARTLSYQIR